MQTADNKLTIVDYLGFYDNLSNNNRIIAKQIINEYEIGITDIKTIADILDIQNGWNDINLLMLLFSMFLSLSEGSVCLNIADENLFFKRYILLSGINLKELNKDIKAGRYSKAITEDENGFDCKPLVYKSGYLYFYKYYIHMKTIENALKELTDDTQYGNMDKAIEIVKNVINSENNIRFNNKQIISLLLPLINRLTIISGGPGRGKTTVLIYIIKCLLAAGYDRESIKLISPTGRGAERIKELLKSSGLMDIEAQTVHRLLGYNPEDNSFRYNINKKLKTKVLIIDETSMIDVVLISNLLESVLYDKIIMLGDKDQLPSVDAGAFLSNVIPDNSKESYSKNIAEEIKRRLNIDTSSLFITESRNRLTDKIIILTESYRTKGNALTTAEEINKKERITDTHLSLIRRINTVNNELWHGIEKNIIEKPFDNLFVINSTSLNIKELKKIYSYWLNHYYNKQNEAGYISILRELHNTEILKEINNSHASYMKIKLLFNIINNSKILTVLRKGIWGCDWINTCLKEMFENIKAEYHISGPDGLPIILKSNNNKLGLYNGTSGIILNNKAFFDMGGFYKGFDFNIIPAYEYAFAITIHKSQGSEYDNVLIVIPRDNDNPILTKELIYTALTRCKKHSIILGDMDSLKAALNRNINREMGINLWN